MLKCPKCNVEYEDGKFCPKCGDPLSEGEKVESELTEVTQNISCTQCGAENKGVDKFCSACGANLQMDELPTKKHQRKGKKTIGISLGLLLCFTIGGLYWGYLKASKEKIVFCSERDGNSEIYTMNADGTNQTRLTNNDASDKFPSFSSKLSFTHYLKNLFKFPHIGQVKTVLPSLQSTKSKLLGKWQELNTEHTEIIEFFSDNRASLVQGEMVAAAGSWNILDDGRVKLEITGFGGITVVLTGKVEGDILRLEDTKGETSEYQKLGHVDSSSKCIALPDEDFEPEFEPEKIEKEESRTETKKPLRDNYIGDFTAKLADVEESHYIKITDVTLKYDLIKHKMLAAELGERDTDIKNAIDTILIKKKASEVNTVKGKEELKEEIREKINSMLVEGQVTEVLFQVIVQ